MPEDRAWGGGRRVEEWEAEAGKEDGIKKGGVEGKTRQEAEEGPEFTLGLGFIWRHDDWLPRKVICSKTSNRWRRRRKKSNSSF